MARHTTKAAIAVNRWNIPASLEAEVISRDLRCVYCGSHFSSTVGPRRSRPSWEHIVNDARIITRENIARCCIGCNASKGASELRVWISSRYCVVKNISPETVAPVVKAALVRPVDPI